MECATKTGPTTTTTSAVAAAAELITMIYSFFVFISSCAFVKVIRVVVDPALR